MMQKLLITLALVASVGFAQPKRVACIGNSITAGAGVDEPDLYAYPAQLQRMLGEGWEVKNFGVSGRTLLRKGDFPYRNEPAFAEAKAFKADVVVIKLGTNDSKPWNWKFSGDFATDLHDLVRAFSGASIFLCTPVPAFPGDWGIRDSVVREGVAPIVRRVAREESATLVDLYAALSGRPECFPDKVHPNEQGALAIAREVYAAICQKNGIVAGPSLLLPIPSVRQLRRPEFSGFLHFSMNTFTGKEWGYGDDSPSLFNPSEFDARAIARTAKAVGMSELILTCKHHDGFCLWPSNYSDYSVKRSPWKNGRGDVVKELSDACRAEGIKFGIYLSPWDRNRADYGRPEYVEYYKKQLAELLTNYGEIAEVWFDGANGGDGYYGGARESRIIDRATYYGWADIFALVRRLQPNALIFSDVGPDLRWVGNENGVAGETCWSMYSPVGEKGGAAAPGDTRYQEGVEGHRDGAHWMPAECDVSIRPGWFYHPEEDSLVKTPEKLFELYLNSVGRNASLLLNVPPDRRGRLHERDINALKLFKRKLDAAFSRDLARGKNATATSVRGEGFAARNATDGRPESFWTTDDSTRGASITIDLANPSRWDLVLLEEPVRLGQRVERFSVESWDGHSWKTVATGTTIGQKRLIKIEPVESRKVRLTIERSRSCPAISTLGLYLTE